MNWLEELSKERVFNYRSTDGSVISGTVSDLSKIFSCEVIGEPGEIINHNDDQYSYAGFDPIKIQQKGVVEFEKNGRKAIMVRNTDGSVDYHSKTKMHYAKTGKIEQQFSDDYQAHLDKQFQNQLLAEKYKPKQKDPLKEMIKNLPEGEYLSDGKSFTPVRDYEEPNVHKKV
jgi:hypothetical protein